MTLIGPQRVELAVKNMIGHCFGTHKDKIVSEGDRLHPYYPAKIQKI